MKINKNSRIYLPLAALSLGAMLVAAQPAFSQPAEKGAKTEKRGGNRGNQVQKMAEHLNLTEAQKTALTPIFENSRARMQALKTNDALTKEQKREQMKQIHTETNAQVNVILTEEQRAKLAELRAQKRNRAGKGKKNKTEA